MARQEYDNHPEAVSFKDHILDLQPISKDLIRRIYKNTTGDDPIAVWMSRKEKYRAYVSSLVCSTQVSEDDIIQFNDTGIIQNGKSGVALTEKDFISYDSKRQQPYILPYGNICKIEIKYDQKLNYPEAVLIYDYLGNICKYSGATGKGLGKIEMDCFLRTILFYLN